MNMEQLKQWNASYDYEFGLTESDLDIANNLRFLIEKKRRVIPTPGDTIICCGPNKTYRNGLIGVKVTGFSSICVEPMHPFVSSPCGKDPYFSVSGGYFISISPRRIHLIEYVGKRKRMFWTWGHTGPRKNGGINFKAETKVWRYYDERIY